jgi:hypothetical protein
MLRLETNQLKSITNCGYVATIWVQQVYRVMRKEVRLLRAKGIDSLILSIELFNRPSDAGRMHAVLIFLDHALEMLFKAAIVHRGGRIRERRSKQTIGFDACVRRGLSDANVKFLGENQALTAQMVNSLRDAAQHHLLNISQGHLFIQAQAGLTLFRDVFKDVFKQDLRLFLPERVLPLSTSPPSDLASLFESEVAEIRKLLKPGSRRRTEAEARLRSLAIVETSLGGEKVQPRAGDLNKLASEIAGGKKSWDDIFPGVASLELTSTGFGPSLDLRIDKKQGIPIRLVPEGTPGAAVVAVKRVNELGFYTLGRDQLAQKLKISGPKTTAAIWFADVKNDPDAYKQLLSANRSSIDTLRRH